VSGKLFSVASWNVEHFRGKPDRAGRVADFISGQHGGPTSMPDIFALYEVEGKDVYRTFMSRFPDHRFHLSEGKEMQEIFIGVHKRLQTFSTQRLEFKVGRDFQRPGLLLSLHVQGNDYTLLFLHVKSGAGTGDFGLRDAAMEKAFNLKKTLDKMAGGPANFIFLGDLNTMGVDDPAPYSRQMDLSSEDEQRRLAYWAGKRGMKMLAKDVTATADGPREVSWHNGGQFYKPLNLDHVIASGQLDIRGQDQASHVVTLLGWPRLSGSDRKRWISRYSDHAMLYFEVW
jgi:endonuclease/exonuclease/phosphatase family metal-dependent hydrolase